MSYIYESPLGGPYISEEKTEYVGEANSLNSAWELLKTRTNLSKNPNEKTEDKYEIAYIMDFLALNFVKPGDKQIWVCICGNEENKDDFSKITKCYCIDKQYADLIAYDLAQDNDCDFNLPHTVEEVINGNITYLIYVYPEFKKSFSLFDDLKQGLEEAIGCAKVEGTAKAHVVDSTTYEGQCQSQFADAVTYLK